MTDMRKLILTLVLTLLAGWSSAAWSPVTMVEHDHAHYAHSCDDEDMEQHDAPAVSGQVSHHVCCQLLAVPHEAKPVFLHVASRGYIARDITRIYTDVVHGIFKPPKSNA